MLTRMIVALIGLGLLAVSLLLFLVTGAAAVSGIADSRDRPMLWWALPCLVVTVFCIAWSLRLVLGKQQRDGGLLPPRMLAGVVIFFVAVFVLSLLSGSYRSVGIPAWVIVVLLVLTLPALHEHLTKAQARQNRKRDPEEPL
jgi:hypothetical protein